MTRGRGFNPQVESYQRIKKTVLDASLLNTQYYKLQIKGKMLQSREKRCAHFYTLV